MPDNPQFFLPPYKKFLLTHEYATTLSNLRLNYPADGLSANFPISYVNTILTYPSGFTGVPGLGKPSIHNTAGPDKSQKDTAKVSSYARTWSPTNGIEALWESFFSNFYRLSEDDWRFQKTYYSKYFGQLYGQFVNDFFGSYMNPIDANDISSTPAAASAPQSIYLTLKQLNSAYRRTDGNGISAQTVIGALQRTYDGVLPISTILPAAADVVLNKGFKFGLRSTSPPPSFNDVFDEDLESFLNTTWLTDGKWATDSSKREKVLNAWALFLNSTDINRRYLSSFLWAYEITSALVDRLQELAIVESKRLNIFTTAQIKAADATRNLKFIIPTGSKDTSAFAYDQKQVSYMQVYKNDGNIAGKYASAQQQAIGSTNSALASQNGTVEQILQQMQSLIQNLFSG